MNDEIVIDLDKKKIIVAGVLLITVVFVTSSYMLALFAFDAPTEDLPLRVFEVDSLDASNVSTSTFSVSEAVSINVTIEKALRYLNFPFTYDYFDFLGDSTCTVLVTILDGSKQPIGNVKSDVATVSVGGYTSVYFVYASGFSAGSYTARVVLWSDGLPNGKAMSYSAGEVTFSVS